MKLLLFVQVKCPKCPAAKAVVKELLKKRNDITLEVLSIDVEDHKFTALMLQIASTPSFAMGNEVLFCGNVPTVEALNDKIDWYIKKFGVKKK